MTILLQVNNVYKNYSEKVLFKNVSFQIAKKDKVALIGINGAGKTTLIKIILGIEESDVDPHTHIEGTIHKYFDYSVGYLSQNNNLNHEYTIFEELMSTSNLHLIYREINKYNIKLESGIELNEKELEEYSYLISDYERLNGYDIEKVITDILDGLAVDKNFWNNQISMLSGGQQTIVALAKVLLNKPDLLILDEPTNHLDLNAISWLENFLQSYDKAVFIVSHDTYFLDKVTNKILELENKCITTYKGNYTDYKIQKEIYLSGALKAFKKEEERREKLKEFVLKYKAGQKAKQARGRQKLLDRMEQSNNPVIPVRKFRLKFEIEESSSNNILKVDKLSKSFQNTFIFNNINLEIQKGDKIGLIGKNGVGKSTILKIINNLETATSGEIVLGQKVKIGYYDQKHQNLNVDNTILDEISKEYNLPEEKARLVCGGFLFSNDEVLKKISSLSGGEKARVSLLKLILSKPNFLIMDEPTNHLDIYAKEVLEEALENYKGTLLVVSHDRSFLNEITNKIYLIEKNKSTEFDGNYDKYLESLQNINNKSPAKQIKSSSSSNKEELSPLINNLKKLQNELKSLSNKEIYFYEQVSNTTNEHKISEFQNKLILIEEKKLEVENSIHTILYEIEQSK